MKRATTFILAAAFTLLLAAGAMAGGGGGWGCGISSGYNAYRGENYGPGFRGRGYGPAFCRGWDYQQGYQGRGYYGPDQGYAPKDNERRDYRQAPVIPQAPDNAER